MVRSDGEIADGELAVTVAPVGRSAELATLVRAWRLAFQTRRMQTVLVSGPSGAGKSCLLDALAAAIPLSRPEMAGHRIDVDPDVDGVGGGTHPYAMWRPVFGQLSGDSHESTPPLATAAAALAGIARAVASRPTVVMLDDVHRADAASLQFLDVLVRNPVEGPLLVAATHRHRDLPHDRARRALSSILRAPGVVRVELRPLSRADLALLLLTRRGFDAPPDVVGQLAAESGGLPGPTLALLDHDHCADDSDDAGTRRRQQQLDRLPAPLRHVVDVVAASGSIDLSSLAALMGSSDEGLLDLLAAAAEQAVVEVVDHRVRLRDGFTAHLCRRSLGLAERRRLNARVATVLDQPASPPRTITADDAVSVAHHWELAGEPRRAAAYSLAAAQRAAASGAIDEAARLYGHGMRLVAGSDVAVIDSDVNHLSADGPSDIDELCASALQVAEKAGPTTAATRLVGALGSLGAKRWPAGVIPLRRADAWARWLECESDAADRAEGALRWAQMLGGRHEQGRAASLLAVILASGSCRPSDIARAVEMGERARQLVSDARLGLRAEAAAAAAVAHAAGLEPRRCAELLEEAAAQARDARPSAEAVRASCLERFVRCRWLLSQGRLPEAEDAGRDGMRLAGHGGSAGWLPWLAGAVAEAVMRQGRWRQAASLAEQHLGADLPRRGRRALIVVIARARMLHGTIEDAETALGALADGPVDPASQAEGALLRLECLLRRGRPDLVTATATEHLEAGLSWPVHTVPALATLCLRAVRALPARRGSVLSDGSAADHGAGHNGADARPSAERWLELAGREPAPLTPQASAWLAAARAEADALEGVVDRHRWLEATRAFASAGDVVRAGEMEIELAEAAMQAGAAEASSLARRALAVATELDAPALLRQARSLRPGPVDPSRLTPREQEVLGLIAQGRSNGEIGRELGIPTKTASVHVSNIIRKLGVSRREEAALALGGGR